MSFDYRALFEGTRDCLQLVCADGRIAEVNAAWQQTLQHNGVGSSLKLKQVVCPASWQDVRRQWCAAKSGESPEPVDARVLRRDGNPVEVTVAFVADPQSEFTCAIFQVKSGKSDELKSVNQMKAVLAAFPDVLIVLDQEGRYRHIYTADHGQLVSRPSEMVGKKITDVLQADAARVGMQTITEVLRTGESATLEYSLTVQGEERWYSTRAVPFGSEDAPCVMWVCRDSTDLVRARERAEQDQELLRNLVQLQERQLDLLACEIHDSFVQDVTGVQMWLEAIDVDDEKLQTMREALRRAVAEARAMVHDLRPVLSDNAGLSDEIWSLVSDFSKRCRFEIQLEQDADVGPLMELLKKTVLRLVQEALQNASRHSDATHVKVRLDRDKDKLRIHIADDGVGFDPKSVSPTRFGLDSIRKRALVFGGHATIASQPGEGTQIDVELPALAPDQGDSLLGPSIAERN